MTAFALILSIAFFASPTYAQGETAQCDPSNFLGGICKFLAFDLKTGIDEFGARLGIVSADVIAQDHENKVIEDQMEHIQILDKLQNDAIDPSVFTAINTNLMKEEKTELQKIDEIGTANPQAVDSEVVSSLKDAENSIASEETFAGIQMTGDAGSQSTNGGGSDNSEKSPAASVGDTTFIQSGADASPSQTGQSLPDNSISVDTGTASSDTVDTGGGASNAGSTSVGDSSVATSNGNVNIETAGSSDVGSATPGGGGDSGGVPA